MRDETGRRAVSPVIGVVLMVALTVILAATVGVAFLGFADQLTQPAPYVSQSSGEFQSDIAGGGDQIVTLFHDAGDPVDVSEIVIRVSFSEHSAVGTLLNLPAEGDDPQPTDQYVRGDDVFDNSANSVSGSIGTEPPDTDGIWAAGDIIRFRLASSAVSVERGEIVTVKILHRPSESVVTTVEIRAD
jgi:flagellin-like protein